MNGIRMWVAGVLLVVLVAPMGGCRLFRRESSEHTKRPKLPEMLQAEDRGAIRDDVVQFTAFLESEVRDAAEDIEHASDDIADRRAALNWKLAVLDVNAQVLTEEDPLSGLIEAWTFCVRQTQYLQQGDGATLFGERHADALQVAQRCQSRAEALAREHLTESALPQLARQIEAYAREYPIHGVFAHEAPAPFTETESGRNVISTVLGMPMRAVEQVSKGLDPTVRLSRSVDHFRALMEDYPALIRWQAQLMLLQMENSPVVQSLADSAATVSESTDRITRMADDLPARLRRESEQLLGEIDKRQPELRKTIDALDTALVRADETLVEAQAAADAWRQTADSATATVQALQELRGEPASGPGAATATAATSQPAFDITDYTQSAKAARAATEELRALLREVRDFVDGPTTDERLERVDELTAHALSSSAAEARQVIDHATWRGVQLAGVVFGLAVVYRVGVGLVGRLKRVSA